MKNFSLMKATCLVFISAFLLDGHKNVIVPMLKKMMLNSAEHEILNAQKYSNIKKCSFFRLR